MNNKTFTSRDYKAFLIAITLFILLQGLTSCTKQMCPEAYSKSTAQFNHNYAKR